MSQPPGPEDLLSTAVGVLRDQVAGELSGKARYQALMVANAIAIAARQIGGTPPQDLAGIPAATDVASLARAIREGALDGRADVYDWIVRGLRAEVRVSNPKALSRDAVEDARR
ncbi:MAG: DUF6285 domain-containing protein [Acidobacteria bacterium]|nr:DUF6285 domain-containing protein [Acidobacteriota bacterium]